MAQDNAFDFALAELKKDMASSFAELKEKAAAKKLKLEPLVFARAKRALRLGSSPKQAATKNKKDKSMAKKKPARASATAAQPKKRGRPKGATVEGSKSSKIRELLATGMGASAIAKKVGCSLNLVYAVKRSSKGGRSAAAPKATTARATTRASSTSARAGLDGVLAGLRAMEAERNALRDAVSKI
ncbi:MAG TPA: hypothetical protein PKE00_07645, partial [Planctomycetota bacterium]|nr:hypothetical protein [Planctomycetota bacterium]